MADSWITNIRHYMDKDGHLSRDLPSPARKLAEYFGDIISAITKSEKLWEKQNLKIPCRRRPDRKPCQGEIHAFVFFDEELGDSLQISWYCPACNDHGIISDWEDTFYDCFDPDDNDEEKIAH